MATIVCVHGAGHQLWGPHQLADRWVPPLRDGLAIADTGIDVAPDDVDVAFYGDLYRTDPSDPEGAKHSEEVRSGLVDLLDNMADKDALHALGRAISVQQAAEMGAQALRYLTEPDIRAAARARLEAMVADDTRVVVAHSLGTIVSYETLCAHPEWPVKTLITLGSPLGRDQLFNLLDPTPVDGRGQWPGGLSSWVNVASVNDPATHGSDIAGHWEDVLDVRIDNGHRPHDVEPYLNARATGIELAAALADAWGVTG